MLAKFSSGEDHEDWKDAYFQLKTNGPQYKNVELVSGKVFLHSVLLHIIFFGDTYYAVMADGSGNQPLLDTHFPDVSTGNKEFVLNEFDNPVYKKLSICLSKPVEPANIIGPDFECTDSANQAVRRAEEARMGGKAGVGGAAGAGAYNQVYVILKPPSEEVVTNIREVLFRFGNWCYHGTLAAVHVQGDSFVCIIYR